KIPWYADETGFYSEWYFEIVGIEPKNENAPVECGFLEKVLKLKKGAKMLDLCCGHGRITNVLASRGYDMTGQDINRLYLSIAKKNADEKGLKIKWVKKDMRQIPFKNKFDAVINMFTSFAVFSSDEEDEKVIKQVSKSLKRGGKFVMDYVNKDFIIRRYLFEDRRKIKNGYVKIKREYNHVKSSHRDTFDIYIKGKLVKHIENDFRFYSVTELTSMMKRNGFKILNVYGDFNFAPLSFDTKNCIIVAEKV
ncbi:MAG: class I SAM-dependent methyltransferase, partial [Chlorobi bacterium]|nr:class I SAM-dependent methyltransferase [Chlorobiota bacterium]